MAYAAMWSRLGGNASLKHPDLSRIETETGPLHWGRSIRALRQIASCRAMVPSTGRTVCLTALMASRFDPRFRAFKEHLLAA